MAIGYLTDHVLAERDATFQKVIPILLGILLVYLGRRGVLEPLVMIPMGLGMAAVRANVEKAVGVDILLGKKGEE